jgi:glucose-6-phosphate isomerase
VNSERARALGFARALRAGARKNIKHIIHVGIGGSDLGPRLLAEAFSDGQGPAVHFVSNVDPAPLHWLMLALEPKETLVLLVSKSFTTAEVKRNGETLKLWLANALGKKAGEHLVAVTAAPEAARAFGVDAKNIYLLWDWIGGRFSIASSVSLSAMAAIGPQRFEEFLRGMAAIDQHFKTAPLDENMPVLLALLALWNVNVLAFNARAVLPYCEALSLWPSYLQQLEMESLGKSADVDGATVDYATAPVIFGSSGTPAQHAYMQALHQGTLKCATEILIVKEGEGAPEHHRMLKAHALAQAEALAFGKDASTIHEGDPALAAQKSFEGNRPSSVIILEKLSPEALGALVALYEHKVFVLGRLWNLNPFDQWGVELGKQLAGPFEAYLAGETDDPRAPESLKEIR